MGVAAGQECSGCRATALVLLSSCQAGRWVGGRAAGALVVAVNRMRVVSRSAGPSSSPAAS